MILDDEASLALSDSDKKFPSFSKIHLRKSVLSIGVKKDIKVIRWAYSSISFLWAFASNRDSKF